MGIQAWPFIQTGTSGAPAVTARQWRQMMVAPFVAMGSAARPLGAKSGIRVGTPSSVVTITGTGPYGWSANGFAGIIDGEANAAAGPYAYSVDTAQTGSIPAAGAALRVDRLDMVISDSDEGDGSGTKGMTPVYTQGAATGGLPPAAPARSHKLVLINVPTSGAPTITWAPDWSGDPGEWVFNTLAEVTAYTTAIGSANVPPQQQVTVLADPTSTNNGGYAWWGSLWLPVSGACVPHALYMKTSTFPWPSTPSIHTWDATPVEGTVSGFTVTGGAQRFTITTPGFWRFAGALGIPGVSGYANVEIRKNGIADRRYNNAASSAAVASAQFAYERQLAVGDYVEFYTTGSNLTGAYNDAGVQLAFLNIDYLHA